MPYHSLKATCKQLEEKIRRLELDLAAANNSSAGMAKTLESRWPLYQVELAARRRAEAELAFLKAKIRKGLA